MKRYLLRTLAAPLVGLLAAGILWPVGVGIILGISYEGVKWIKACF